MPRARRIFESNAVYEISFRAREGIPTPGNDLITTILESIIARAARKMAIHLSDMIWMGNHVHLIVVSRDIGHLSRFYAELKKRITDFTKKFLGLKHLTLWRERPMVAKILDVPTLISRLIYIYSNPQSSNLTATIEEYPGLNTWRQFVNAPATPLAAYVKKVPWIRLPHLETLTSNQPSKSVQDMLIQKFSRIKKKIPLIIEPFKAFSALGVTSHTRLEECRKEVIAGVRKKEAELTKQRQEQKITPLGVVRLSCTPILAPYKPDITKRYSRPYVLGSSVKTRKAVIASMKLIAKRARQAYLNERYSRTVQGDWPPGVFRPPMYHSASALFYPKESWVT